MNVNKVTLPYPVLGIKDDILPLPDPISCIMESIKDTYVFKFKINLNNKKIEDLIAYGFANYVCEVECSTTLFRKGYVQKSNEFVIVIPKWDVSGVISFEVTVTASKNIQFYENPGFHEDYKGYKFNLEPGDILAYLGQMSYDADIKYDQLQAVSSFMEITEGLSDSGTRIELGHDKIRIALPKEMFDFYRTNFSRNKQVASVIHSSLVFNALLEALYNIRDNKDRLWGRTIKYRLQTEEPLKKYFTNEEELFNDDEVFNIAQQLLGDPYKRMFDCLTNLVDNDSNED